MITRRSSQDPVCCWTEAEVSCSENMPRGAAVEGIHGSKDLLYGNSRSKLINTKVPLTPPQKPWPHTPIPLCQSRRTCIVQELVLVGHPPSQQQCPHWGPPHEPDNCGWTQLTSNELCPPACGLDQRDLSQAPTRWHFLFSPPVHTVHI